MSTLLEDWHFFEDKFLPADFGEAQRRKAKVAFYSGAMRVADRLLFPDKVNHQFVINLHLECQEIANSIGQDFRKELER